MGAQHMQRPIRRGTSKAVPVVVSAGLAVGVFCGLLFGVGTGKDQALAGPAKGNNVKKAGEPEDPKPEPGAAPKGLGATSAQPVPPKNAGSAAVVAAAGSGATAGSAAKPAVEEKKVIKLTFVLKPEAAANDVKITVDGKEIDGLTTELPYDTKSMKVEIKANGYRTLEKTQQIVPGDEIKIEYELTKKSTGGGTRPIKRPERPTNAGGGGGLIDI